MPPQAAQSFGEAGPASKTTDRDGRTTGVTTDTPPATLRRLHGTTKPSEAMRTPTQKTRSSELRFLFTSNNYKVGPVLRLFSNNAMRQSSGIITVFCLSNGETDARHLSAISNEDPSSVPVSQQDNAVVFLIHDFFECLNRNIMAADFPPPTRFVRRPRAQRSEPTNPIYTSFEDVSG